MSEGAGWGILSGGGNGGLPRRGGRGLLIGGGEEEGRGREGGSWAREGGGAPGCVRGRGSGRGGRRSLG